MMGTRFGEQRLDDDVGVTVWLERARSGDAHATAKLWESVYENVRLLAKRAVEREHGRISLAATDLAHEAYLRLAGNIKLTFASRSHLLATVARAIRRTLVDRARARQAEKRGGGAQRVPFDNIIAPFSAQDPDVMELDVALAELENLEPRQAQLIELRFFGGLTLEEAADVAGVSRRTVAADWALARAWLRRRLGANL